jgi:hypothetical protein
VMLNTYAGSRVSLRNSSIPVRPLLSILFFHDATAARAKPTDVSKLPTETIPAAVTKSIYFAVKITCTGKLFGG